jgi:glycosyltransferase involved in cell wall biosynthesis
MSKALLEAMAMTLPVVATAVGGTPEVIADGQSGLLVPADDPQAMAAAIGRVLDDPAAAARLAASARRTVEERYAARNMVRRLEDVYAAVAASGDSANGRRVALVATREHQTSIGPIEGLNHP